MAPKLAGKLLVLLSFQIALAYGEEIHIEYSGVLLDRCDVVHKKVGCAGPVLSPLEGSTFSGSITIPTDLGPDLQPDDLDLGYYLVSGHFEFDGIGDSFDVSGGIYLIVWVNDCNFSPSCNPSDNFVWIGIAEPVNGLQYWLLLNGTKGDLGPDSDQLPSVERLQAMAAFAGNFEIGTPDFSEALLTGLNPPSPMEITIYETSESHTVPLPTIFEIFLGVVVLQLSRTAMKSNNRIESDPQQAH